MVFGVEFFALLERMRIRVDLPAPLGPVMA
jgi:hypothetical protein